jgi:outer membrane lipoprotein
VRIVLLLAVVAVAGCSPPAHIAGDFPRVNLVDVQQGGHVGERVRWGGVIVETKPTETETCMQIVSLPLGRRARPRIDADQSFGRFLACAPAFYDPEIYAPEREVTVVGTITGVERGKVDEQEYDFPRLAIDAIYLWPPRARREYGDEYGPYSYAYPYYYPYYYPGPYAYPYYWGGWGWYGGWGGGWGGGWHGHGDGHGHGSGGHGGGHGGRH